MLKTIIASFDLKGVTEEQRWAAYVALAKLGLLPISPNKELRLPWSTVLGDVEVPNGFDIAAVRDSLMSIIGNAVGPKRVERILVAEVSNWACHGGEAPDDDVWLKRLTP